VIGLFEKPLFPKIKSYRDRVCLMLDTIQDPGNLGSIIRTADWFGLNTIICSKDTADVFNPKVVQSTMGSIARVQLLYEELEVFINENDLPPIYVASLEGKSIFDMQPLKEGIILIGNESKGVSERLTPFAHQFVTIPRSGKAESLNAAIATGIVLSHLISR
jgi:TrmH family RNA methyltransferase